MTYIFYYGLLAVSDGKARERENVRGFSGRALLRKPVAHNVEVLMLCKRDHLTMEELNKII